MVKYDHVLLPGKVDGRIRCNCGETFANIHETYLHFESTVRNAGWRGLWNRIRNR